MNTHKLLSSQYAAPLSRIFICALLSLMLLPAFTPASRAQLNVSDGANIAVSGSSDLGGTLSTLTFDAAASGTFSIAPGANLVLDSAGATTQRLAIPGGNSAAFVLGAGASLTFSGNSSAVLDGGVFSLAAGASLVLDGRAGAGFVLQNNSISSNGGALHLLGAGIRVDVSNALFQSNTAASGGAFYAAATSAFSATFTDVSFIGNHSIADGTRGGAIAIVNPGGNSTLNINAQNGASYFAGNTYGSSSTPGGLAVTFTTLFDLNINIVTAASASLVMLDPFHISQNANNASSNVTTTKTGAGTWYLAGTNIVDKTGNNGVNSLNINAGTLHLYRAGEMVNVPGLGTVTAAAGHIRMTGATANAPARFALAAGATLSIGGGNSIAISSPTQSAAQWITFSPGSTLSYDVSGAFYAGLGGSASSPLLSLVSSGLNSTFALASSGTFDFNLNFASWVSGSYNLLSVVKNSVPYLTTVGTPSGANNVFLGLANGAGSWQQALTDSITYGAGVTAPGTAPTFSLDASGNLWVIFPGTPPVLVNNVLAWTGAIDSSWRGPTNWNNPLDTATKFSTGDVINLANNAALATRAIDVDGPVTVGGMYVSGTENYTITGSPIVATTASVGLSFDPSVVLAASGKLIVGGSAAPDGLTYATSNITPAVAYQGALTLDNSSNNFQQGIEIYSGALVGNADNLGAGGAGAPGITVAAGGTLTFNQTAVAGDAAYSAPIAGAGRLNKTGAASLTLNADYSGFTGQTAIAAGSLILAPAAKLGGAASVSSGATLVAGNNSSILGAVTVSASATLAAADGASILGNVTLGDNSTLQVGIGAAGSQTLTLGGLSIGALATDTSILDFTVLTNKLVVTGNLVQTGLATINVSATTPGTHQLINVLGTGLASTNWLTVTCNDTLLDTSAYSLSIAGNWLTVFFEGNISKIITWTGAANRNWDSSSFNWLTVETTPAADTFGKGDIVNFTEAAAGTINIATSATAGAIYVSGTSDYTFTGAGITTNAAVSSVLGAANNGKLVLGKIVTDADTIDDAPFTGVLDFTGQNGAAGANNFTGGIDIYSGVIRISTATQLGARLSTLNFLGDRDTSTAAVVRIAEGSDITFSGAGTGTANRLVVSGTVSGAFTLEEDSTLTFTNYRQGEVNGGAILVTNGASLLFNVPDNTSRIVFKDNSTISSGAALGISGSDSRVQLSNVLFQSNTATNGGALHINGGFASITSGTFQNNAATAAGGAVYSANSPAFQAVFNDVSFIGNHSASETTRGGAIYILTPAASSTLTLNALNGASFFAGNTYGAAKNSSGISVNDNGNFAMTININTAPGAMLHMLDPFYLQASANNAGCVVTVNKDGAGVWKLGGDNTIYKGGGNQGGAFIEINAGTLHLYRAGEQVDVPGLGIVTARAGNITMGGVNANAPVRFHLYPGASLSVGGGNTISISSPTQSAGQHMYLDPGSTLTYDLIGAGAAGLGLDASSPLLTLNSTGLNSTFNFANTGTFNFNLNFATWTPGSFNLLVSYKGTAAGTPAGAQKLSYLATLGFKDGEDDWQKALMDAMTFEGLAPDPRNITTSFSIDAGGNLWVSFISNVRANNVLTWTGADNASWLGWSNWSAFDSGTNFNKGDVINLADNAALATRTLAVDTIGSATLGGVYVSGSADFTITGNPIVATTEAVGAIFDPNYVLAASGKLIVGGSSASNGYTYATSDTNADVAFHGTLALENKSNNFTKGIFIYSGALAGNSANLGAGTAGIKIFDSGTLIFNQVNAGAYSAPFAGAGALVKTGPATLTLDANYSTFTGRTTINTGLLLLAPDARLGGNITVNDTGALGGGNGATALGNVSLNDGATIQVGAGLSVGEIFTIAGNLAIDGDVTLDFARLNNRLLVQGAITHSGSGAVTVNIDSFQAGSFVLGNLAAIAAIAAPVTIDGIAQYTDARQQATLATNGNDLLVVGSGDISRIMHWTGAASGTWSLTRSDWDNRDPVHVETVFGSGDRVVFDDNLPAGSPATATVVPAGVSVSDMHVLGAINYTIAGGGVTADPATVFTGPILTPAAATGKLYKDGPSTLTLANNGNNFTGGIQLNSGILNIAGLTTAGGTSTVSAAATLQFSGTEAVLNTARLEFANGVTINGNGSLKFDTLVLSGTVNAPIAANNTLSLSGHITPASQSGSGVSPLSPLLSPAASPLALGAAAPTVNCKLETENSGGFAAAPAASGGVDIIKTGPGELQFTAPSTGNAVTRLDAGTVRFAAATTAAAPLVAQTIILNGGQLAFGNDPIALTVNLDTARNWSGVTVLAALDPAITGTISGINDIVHIKGSGTVFPRLTGGIHLALDPGAGQPVTLGSTASDFNGAIRVDSGAFILADTRVLGVSSTNVIKFSLNGGALNILASATLLGDVQLRAPENTVDIADGLAVTLTRVTRPASYAGNSTQFPVPTTFIKAGSGTLTMTGVNQATDMIVAEGRYIQQGNHNAVDTCRAIRVDSGAVFEFATSNTGQATARYDFFAGKVFRATASGQTRASFVGDGALEINKGVLFMYNPVVEIARININGPDTALCIINNDDRTTFGLNSLTTVDQGSLAITSYNTQIGAVVLKNGAKLGFTMDATLFHATGTLAVETTFPGNHFHNNEWRDTVTHPSGTTVIDDYYLSDAHVFKKATIKSLVSEGGAPAALWFNINLARGGGDHLAILTAPSGTFTIGTINYGELPAKYNRATELISAPASTDATFIILTPEIDLGLYKYTTTLETAPAGGAGGAGGISIRVTGTGAMSNSASIINSVAAMLPATWFTEMHSVHQRMGELHHETLDSARSPRDAGGISTWLRGYGAQTNYNSKTTGTPFRERHFGTEAGLDARFPEGPITAYAGAFIGYGQSQRLRTDAGDARSDSAFGGVYLTLRTTDGWYLDLAGKANNFKNRFTAIAPTGETTTARYTNNALGGSIELGKYCDPGHGWIITPQIQCARTTIDAAFYKTDSGIAVTQAGGAVTRLRAGLMIGRSLETTRLGTLHAYAKAHCGGQWTSNGDLQVRTPSGQRATYNPRIKGDSFEVGAGLNWLLTRTTQLYADYTTTQAAYYKQPWSFNLGIRHNW